MRPPVLKPPPKRPQPRLVDRGDVFTALTVALLLAVAAAALVALLRHPVAGGAEAEPAPTSAVLERCRRMGPPAGDDPECRAAWADARKAFFQIEERQP